MKISNEEEKLLSILKYYKRPVVDNEFINKTKSLFYIETQKYSVSKSWIRELLFIVSVIGIFVTMGFFYSLTVISILIYVLPPYMKIFLQASIAGFASFSLLTILVFLSVIFNEVMNKKRILKNIK